MNRAVRKLEAKENAQREKYAIESLLNVDDDLSLHILDTSYQSSFYRELICSQFKAEYKSVMEKNGVEEPLAQAYNGGMILKNMLGDNGTQILHLLMLEHYLIISGEHRL